MNFAHGTKVYPVRVYRAHIVGEGVRKWEISRREGKCPFTALMAFCRVQR